MTPELPLPLVLLAGGRGERLGQAKGLRLVQQQTPLCAWQAERFALAGGKSLVLVVGADAAAYTAAFAALPKTLGLHVAVVVNAQPQLGPFSSLQCGLSYLAHAALLPQGCFVLPVDVPSPSPEVWQALSTAWHAPTEVSPPCLAVVPTYMQRGGHPVLLAAAFCHRLLSLSPRSTEARLDLQLSQLRHAGQVLRLEVKDSQICLNLNTETQWHAWESTSKTADGINPTTKA